MYVWSPRRLLPLSVRSKAFDLAMRKLRNAAGLSFYQEEDNGGPGLAHGLKTQRLIQIKSIQRVLNTLISDFTDHLHVGKMKLNIFVLPTQ